MDDANIKGLRHIIQSTYSNRGAGEGPETRRTLNDDQILLLFNRIDEADAIIVGLLFGETGTGTLAETYETKYKTGVIVDYSKEPLRRTKPGWARKQPKTAPKK